MKTKIVFAGVMGAILMTAGANAATTTSVATKGYVDRQIDNVNSTINNLGDTYATVESVTNAINTLDTDSKAAYEVVANKVTKIAASLSEEERNAQYPTVGAVLDAMPKLSEEDKQAIKDLTGTNGLITRVETVENQINTLTGDGENSIASQIADAITEHNTAADGKYQAQSKAAYSFGNADGGWDTLTPDQQAALNSKITAEKVTSYDATVTAVDGLNGADGTITKIQEAIDGLNGKDGQPGKVEKIETTVTQIETVLGDETEGLVADVAKNKEDIAKNAEEILKKITTPTNECKGPESTCVLMIQGTDVSWTPVTAPVADPVDNSDTGE